MKTTLILFLFTLLIYSCKTQSVQILEPEPQVVSAETIHLQDDDDDGVLNDFDTCKDTPAGARIDGSGCALDTDLDGIIDLYDKCVTVPGVPEHEGCRKEDSEYTWTGGCNPLTISFTANSIELNENTLLYIKEAARVINKYGNGIIFIIEGHTDASGNEAGNIKISLQRAQAVKDKLVSLGVNSSQLEIVGKGSSDLLFPECNPASNCHEYKNQANRRVIFKMKRK